MASCNSKESYSSNKPEWNVKPLPEIPKLAAYEFLTRAAKKYPQKPAFISFDRLTTYQELDELSNRFANALIETGIQKGDRVAFYLPNCLQAIIAFYGIIKAGAIIVTCNVMLKENELAYQLKDSGSKAIVTLDRLYPIVEKVKNQTGLEHTFLTNIRDYSAPGARFPPEFEQEKPSQLPAGVEAFASALAKASSGAPGVAINAQQDLLSILYTSGTTSLAKGVMLNHYNYCGSSITLPYRQGWKEDDVCLFLFPVFHVGNHALVLCPSIYMGMTMVNVPKFEAREVLRLIEKYRVTVAHMPPTAYIGLLNHPDFAKYDLSSLWYCACGGSPLPPALINAWKEKTGVRLLDAYGCTETSGTAPGAAETPVKNREGSAGTTHFEIKIIDQEGKIVPRGTVGEIFHRGPGVALGYWNKPEETKEVFIEDGWWRSGDAGYIDEDDFVYIVDRYKDLIVTSGFNVAPADVEKVIYNHEAVQEVCVYGVPDAYRVEAVKAAIVLKDAFKEKVTEQEIIAFCRANMAVYKTPRLVEFVAEIPKTTSGKTLRRLLREKDAQKGASSK